MRIDEVYLKSQIRAVEDWPKPGVTFRDITSIFENPAVTRMVVDSFIHRYLKADISHIAALDSRGFLLGSTLAYTLNKPLVLFRKKGKLPPSTLAQDYQLEYGSATLEVKTHSFGKGDRVLLVDDLIATGGTLLAADTLIRNSGASTVEAAAIIDLPDLGGSQKLHQAGISTYALCAFDGD